MILVRIVKKISFLHKWKWVFLYFSIFFFCVYLIVNAIIPAYKSPVSRLYSSSIGYPALMRNMGKKIPVDVSIVEFRDMDKVISATGVIDYENQVPISIEVPGTVTNINFSLGEKVDAGDILINMSSGGKISRVANLDVEIKKTVKEKTELDYLREKKAFDMGLIAQSELEEYKVAYDKALVDYQKSKATFENSDLTRRTKKDQISNENMNVNSEIYVISPLSGTVIERNVQVGDNVINQSGRALVIGSNLVFKAKFSQRYVNEVKIGQRVDVFLRAYPGEIFQATVLSIDRLIQPAVRGKMSENLVPYVFNAFLKLDLNDQSVKTFVSGMNGYVLLTQTKKRMVIPDGAIMRYSGQQGMVLVVNKETKKLETRKIKFDVADKGYVGVLSGLEVEDWVVKSGQIALLEGDSVVVDKKSTSKNNVAVSSSSKL